MLLLCNDIFDDDAVNLWEAEWMAGSHADPYTASSHHHFHYHTDLEKLSAQQQRRQLLSEQRRGATEQLSCLLCLWVSELIFCLRVVFFNTSVSLRFKPKTERQITFGCVSQTEMSGSSLFVWLKGNRGFSERLSQDKCVSDKLPNSQLWTLTPERHSDTYSLHSRYFINVTSVTLTSKPSD